MNAEASNLVVQRVYQGSGLLAILSSNIYSQPVCDAEFFAVPDFVTARREFASLLPAGVLPSHSPVSEQYFRVAPGHRGFVDDARVDYFVREAAAAGVDVLQVPVSFEGPDVPEVIAHYQRLLDADGLRVGVDELLERSSSLSASFGGSLEHHLSEDFFAVSEYLRDSVQRQDPVRSWEVGLLARYVADEWLPGSVLRQGLSDVGLLLSDEIIGSLEAAQTTYGGSQFPHSQAFATGVLFREINAQLYGPL